MTLSSNLLNDGLSYYLETGNNLVSILSKRLLIKYPNRTQLELINIEKVFKKTNKESRDFISKNPKNINGEMAFINFDEFENFMKTRHQWLNEANMNRLYGLGCYQASR